jgi:hypothetical protein
MVFRDSDYANRENLAYVDIRLPRSNAYGARSRLGTVDSVHPEHGMLAPQKQRPEPLLLRLEGRPTVSRGQVTASTC